MIRNILLVIIIIELFIMIKQEKVKETMRKEAYDIMTVLLYWEKKNNKGE